MSLFANLSAYGCGLAILRFGRQVAIPEDHDTWAPRLPVLGQEVGIAGCGYATLDARAIHFQTER
ncbi:MAG: hypothetical protein FJY37_06660 [Betaproteobacteria bacterium]|nr:hypothetical protein [Betaproteobacteria bacterium]